MPPRSSSNDIRYTHHTIRNKSAPKKGDKSFFIWSASKRSPKEFGGQGNGLSQKLASRKDLAAERQADQIPLRNQRPPR